MSRWYAFALMPAALGVAAMFGTAAAPPDDRVSPRSDSIDLLVLGGKPARLQIHVEIGGKSVPSVWDETFAKMLAFYDRDGDGTLNKAEAGRLPSEFVIRQILWGQVTFHSGASPAFSDLDRNGDGKADGEELADCYRRLGLGGVLVGVGKAPASEKLTDAILRHCDTNKDGKTDEAEWRAAADSLRKLDKNDDELIGPGELADKTLYPGATGSRLCSPPSPDGRPDPITDALPLIVLPIRQADAYWIAAAADRIRKCKAVEIRPDAFEALRNDPPAAAWIVQLGVKGETRLQAADGKPPANARLRFESGDVRIELRADEGKLSRQFAAAGKRMSSLFADCDTNADRTLDSKETATPKGAPFQQLLAAADRDNDGNLSEAEFEAWLDLQRRIADSHVLLTVIDHAAGLLEFLDADHDGSLSVRELRSAWDRLKAAGCVTAQGFDRTKLPRQILRGGEPRGHPLTAIGKPVRPGPAWFLAMDRNGDGDVSRKEFTGPTEVFDKLDADKNGVLDSGEAALSKK